VAQIRVGKIYPKKRLPRRFAPRNDKIWDCQVRIEPFLAITDNVLSPFRNTPAPSLKTQQKKEARNFSFLYLFTKT
jgi:hypothetical protein